MIKYYSIKASGKGKFSAPWIICFLSGLFLFFSTPAYEDTTNLENAGNIAKSSAKTAGQNIKSGTPSTAANYGLLPLYFIKNAGQKDSHVRYYAQTKKYMLWATDNSLIFDSLLTAQKDSFTAQRDVSCLTFPGANTGIEIQPEVDTDYHVNYLIGNDPSAWLTDLPTSESIIYKNLFDNIDLMIYGRESRIEYDWIIKPGGEADKIRFKYNGVTKVSLSPNGDLIVTTRFGEILHKKPEAWQMIDGEKIPVRAEFIKITGNSYGFKVSEYDNKHELIIDPLIIPYSTYLGGTDIDYGYAIAVDSQGSAYVTGYSNSFNFPVQNAYQWWRTGNEVFVTKFSPSGASLIYSTYIGGAGTDRANGIALDSSNNAYITGYTTSNNFPTVNAYDNSFSASNDVFVTKIAPAGNSLVYSTYIGDTLSDIGNDIAVDTLNRAYVTGTTTSTTFPTINAYDASHNVGTDAFVLRLAEAGNALEYSTFLGTASTDEAYSVAVDSSFSAYIAGRTNGVGFPTLNPFQAARSGGYDAFITKFSALGNTLVYSTYLGGTSDEECRGITIDAAGCAYVIGNTLSNNFPTLNPLQAARAGNTDLFITKMSAAGNTRVFSTYLGGTLYEYARGIAIDSTNSIYITGYTTSVNFPTFAATQSTHAGGTNDAFISNISNTGGSLLYSTYLGGTLSDVSWAIAVSSEPAAYICGYTLSTDFPLNNAYDTTLGGTTDVFCVKYLWYINNIPPVAVVTANPTTGQLPLTVNFDGSGSSDSDGTIVSYSWDFGDGSTGSGMSVSHEYDQQGTYTATLTVMDNRNDTATDTVFIQVSGNIPPVVVLSASATAGVAPLTVDFDGSRSYDPDGSIVSYRWNFGDGTYSSLPRAAHTYSEAGTYYSSLMARDNSGLSSSEFVTINVYNLQAVSCIIDTYGINRIKANNKADTWIGVLLIDSLSGAPAIILPRINVRLEASSGSFLANLNFESTRALYSQRISSGVPGLATITAYISGVPKCSASLEYIWPKPPAQVKLTLNVNRSLFTYEYAGLLTWQPNPYEIFPPSAYRVYRSIDDSSFELIGQVDSMIFQLEEQHLSKSKKYSYVVATVDTEGDESDPSPVVSSK